MFEQFSAEEAAPRRRRLLASLGLSALGYAGVTALGLWLFADMAPDLEERVVDVVFAKPPPPPPPPPPPTPAPVADAPPPPPKTSLPKVKPLVAPTEVPQSPPPEATPQPPAAPVDPTPVGAAAGEGENNSDAFGRSGGKEGGTAEKAGGSGTGGAVVLPPGATEPDCTSGVGQPVYPPLALAAGFEGEVSVKVIVKVDGSVELVKFIKRDPNFDGAVTDFLRTLRCRAAVYNGSSIAVFKNLRFPFRRRQ